MMHQILSIHDNIHLIYTIYKINEKASLGQQFFSKKKEKKKRSSVQVQFIRIREVLRPPSCRFRAKLDTTKVGSSAISRFDEIGGNKILLYRNVPPDEIRSNPV